MTSKEGRKKLSDVVKTWEKERGVGRDEGDRNKDVQSLGEILFSLRDEESVLFSEVTVFTLPSNHSSL